ncbi:MAG: DMT family transporter [Promethearchaeota archaeon]
MLIIAIIIQIIGVTILNLSMILQKKGADEIPNVHDVPFMQSVKNFLTNRAWFIGYVGTMVGSVLTFVTLAWADLSILQPFMGVGIIVQVFFCGWYLKEKVDRVDVVSSAIIVVGVVLVGISSRAAPQNNFPDSLALISRTFPLVFQALLTAFAILAFAYTVLKKWSHADIWTSIFTGITSVLSYLYIKIVLAAVMDFGFSALLYTNILAWMMLFISFAFSTVSFLSKQLAYQHGRAILVNNIFNAFNIALPVLVGIFILDEWNGMPRINGILQVCGVIVILCGMFMLMRNDLKSEPGCATHDAAGNVGIKDSGGGARGEQKDGK